MAGHSHSANIAVRKGKADQARAKLFSKLSRYIIIAVRNGGGDPDSNLKLRYAIDKARSVSMPRDNIEKAIKRGTGELEGDVMEELAYEGFGPGGVAIYVESATDNRNRTNGEVRMLFQRGGGNMGGPGCVGYLFDRKGLFVIEAKGVSEDALMNATLEAGADDMKLEGDVYEVTCEAASFSSTQEALTKAGFTLKSAEIAMLPKASAEVDVETGKKIVKLMELLDDHDDVQNVWTNANLTSEMMEA
ncbi:MAG: YebC/PmpR family DNA-binding transcriptional regulator [Planctomycetes bacterium]|nr:YebC/PmpR family DNA-binding transcriptional regulator [Planctomycetota bacterium]